MAKAGSDAAIGRKLREARRQRGVTLRALARRAGCSAGHLSLIERDRVSPTVATLMRICNSLGIALTHFFTGSAERGNHLVRRGERSTLVSRASGAHHELLKAPGNECALNPMLVTLRPNSRSGEGPHAHAGEEFVLLTKGRLRFRIGEQEYVLQRGHSLTFPSTLPHAWWNPYPAPAEAIWVSRGDVSGSRVDVIDHERRNGRPTPVPRGGDVGHAKGGGRRFGSIRADLKEPATLPRARSTSSRGARAVATSKEDSR